MTISRYQIFDYLADWGARVQIRYEFNTVIASSIRYREQRKALRDTPQRLVDVSLFVEAERADVFNNLRASLSEIVFVPIYAERFTTSTTGNVLKISVAGTESLYNLRNLTRRVLVTDLKNRYAPEVIVTGELNFNELNLEVNTWVFDQYTVIYPLLPAYLDSIENVLETLSHSVYALSFKEYVTEEPTFAFYPTYQDIIGTADDIWQDNTSADTIYQNN